MKSLLTVLFFTALFLFLPLVSQAAPVAERQTCCVLEVPAVGVVADSACTPVAPPVCTPDDCSTCTRATETTTTAVTHTKLGTWGGRRLGWRVKRFFQNRKPVRRLLFRRARCR